MKKVANKLQTAEKQTPFAQIAKVFLKQSGVAEKKMFGTTALTNKRKVFAFPWKGNLVVKLPKEQVVEIVASKKGIYFDPGHGRTSKEWVEVYAKAENQWLDFIREAKEYVISK